MVCDVCKERDAAVHLTTIEDNAVHQLHLCEKCAAERGVETPAAAPNHPLGEFLHDVQQQVALTGLTSGESARCPFCNTTMADFRTTGRWGCARCYTNFEAAIRELSAPRAGESPARGTRLSRRRWARRWSASPRSASFVSGFAARSRASSSSSPRICATRFG